MTNEELIEALKSKKNLKECAQMISDLGKNKIAIDADAAEAFSSLDLYSFAKFLSYVSPYGAVALRANTNFEEKSRMLLKPYTSDKSTMTVSACGEKVWSNAYAFEKNAVSPFLKGPLSQWHKESFVVDGITYKTAEHYMMAQKAIFFEDQESYHLIMKSDSPKEVQAMGRMVANFDESLWDSIRSVIVYNGNVAKFTQCKSAYDELMKTKDTYLAEGNPNDLIWGTGLSTDDPAILDKSKWKGRNLLGRILTLIRTELEEGTLQFVG